MMDSYISSGILEPLNTYVDSWDEWSNFTKEYVDMFTRNGSVYAVPIAVNPMLFAYNKALFAEAGLQEPPKTWDEALEMAKKINNPDNQVSGYATLAAEWTEWFFQYYVWQAGGDLTKENEDGTAELTFTDPAVIEAAKYYQSLKNAGVLQSDLTLKFNDLTKNFALGKIGMMPFASDWVTDAVSNGMDPDDLGLCLPPAGPSGEQSTAIAGECYVINAKTDQAKKDAAWEYISFYTSHAYLASYYENLATKGATSPVIIPRDDMTVTDFYEFPDEYKEVLESAKMVGRLEFYGKSSFGPYIDRAVQKILTDPNADPETEFAAAQKLCEDEALAAFNEANKKYIRYIKNSVGDLTLFFVHFLRNNVIITEKPKAQEVADAYIPPYFQTTAVQQFMDEKAASQSRHLLAPESFLSASAADFLTFFNLFFLSSVFYGNQLTPGPLCLSSGAECRA